MECNIFDRKQSPGGRRHSTPGRVPIGCVDRQQRTVRTGRNRLRPDRGERRKLDKHRAHPVHVRR